MDDEVDPFMSKTTKQQRQMSKNKRNNGSEMKASCCGSSSSRAANVRLAMQILTLIVAVLGLILIIVMVALPSKADSEIRIFIDARPENVIGGSGGEAGAYLRGKFVEDYSGMDIFNEYHYPVTMSAIQTIVVRGPIPIGSQTGPILFTVCGLPGATVCDTATLPGYINIRLKTLEPNNVAALPVMRQIRANRDLYYLEVWTAAKPVEPGALRAPLSISMGPGL